MEISGKIPPLDSTAYVKAGSKTAQTSEAAPAAPQGDRVELSQSAREVQAAHEAVRQMDDVDHEKVAKIKAQIEAGTYEVDAQKVAGKMLEETLLDDID